MARSSVAFLALLLAGVGAGCGAHRASTQAAPSPPTATAAPGPHPLVSPLTGLPATALRPVVGVKIDNVGVYGTDGLDAADVVYCEEVEGGLTRLLALYSATPPTVAGPVRSGRQSDLQLLAQYGRIALAFSGANSVVAAQFRAANLVDDSYDDQTAAFTFDTRRPTPYQFLAKVSELAQQHPGVLAKDVGFRFGGVPAAASNAGTTVAVHYPDTLMSATLVGSTYAFSRDGRALTTTDDAPVTASNVLLQEVAVHTTGFVDHNGKPTPYSVTIGSGRATLLRGGRAYAGTWSRPSAAAPTTWTSDGGGSLTLAPGRTWVLLVPTASTVVLG